METRKRGGTMSMSRKGWKLFPILLATGATLLHAQFAPLQITTYPVLPPGMTGVPYAGSIAATGGAAPYTFSVVRGGLPAGLAFSSGGSLSGTPTTFGSSGFTVQVTDSAGGANLRDFTLVIAPAKLILTTQPLSNAILGTPLSIQFTASGGVPPYSFVEFDT